MKRRDTGGVVASGQEGGAGVAVKAPWPACTSQQGLQVRVCHPIHRHLGLGERWARGT